MKVTAIGISQMSGVAKESGAPYLMTRLQTLVPFNPYTNKPRDYSDQDFKAGKPYTVRAGFGLQVSEIDVLDEAFTNFNKLEFPAILDLETDTVNRYGRLQVIVVGYKEAKKLSAS